MPIQISLWKMEVIGFPVNEGALGNLSKHILEVMKKLERKMFELHGSRFNLSSTSAVARVRKIYCYYFELCFVLLISIVTRRFQKSKKIWWCPLESYFFENPFAVQLFPILF